MTFAGDDLTALLRGPAPHPGNLTFGQAVVREWDQLTSANTVLYRGAVLSDLPIVGGTEALVLKPGSVVGILSTGNQIFILGRVIVPNTPEASDALSAIGAKGARVLDSETTSSTTFGDLPAKVGPQVTVTIGSSRRALVFISCSAGAAGPNGQAIASCRVSGASTITPEALAYMAAFISSAGATTVNASIASMMLVDATDGLNSGENTFKLEYAAYTAGVLAAFKDRKIAVVPL